MINPRAAMNGMFMVFLTWGEINDPNTAKLRIYREGPDGRLLRYTDPPDPQPPGRTEVMYRTPDGMLGRRWYADGQWHGEQKIPASIGGDPALVSLNPAHIDVYYRTPAGRLAHRWALDDGRTWQAEEDVGGDPVAVALNSKSIRVYYKPPGGGYLRVRPWSNGRWYDEANESAPTGQPPAYQPFTVDFGLAAACTQRDHAFLFYAHTVPVLLYRRYH
ncbi:hypothetical protein [Actinomadura nitritigenes]|uniref:hypothetical protein n=1 Tax=Actinomadura nitritigenes TaxID=134602 RepID=UPI003D90E259